MDVAKWGHLPGLESQERRYRPDDLSPL